MPKIESQRAKELIARFAGLKPLVLGDIMLDRYFWGQVDRISPEAPVPVVDVRHETSCLGGAGNVYRNLEDLGARPILVGVVGKDNSGQWIRSHVADVRGIFSLENRPTSVKTRVIAHQQQVVRVDQEGKGPLPKGIRTEIADFIQGESFHGLFISDYNKGVISSSLMSSVLEFTRIRKIPVFVDPKIENIHLYSPITLLTPNHHEAARIAHKPCQTDEQALEVGKKIFSKVDTQHLIIKRGEHGMTIFQREEKHFHIPTLAKEVYDVTGAGDTVIATAGLALLAGASIQEAAILANAAAGIVVGKIGTATVSTGELRRILGCS
jgi:rfaE bifunctional protein kinase chain/domain